MFFAATQAMPRFRLPGNLIEVATFCGLGGSRAVTMASNTVLFVKICVNVAVPE